MSFFGVFSQVIYCSASGARRLYVPINNYLISRGHNFLGRRPLISQLRHSFLHNAETLYQSIAFPSFETFVYLYTLTIPASVLGELVHQRLHLRNFLLRSLSHPPLLRDKVLPEREHYFGSFSQTFLCLLKQAAAKNPYHYIWSCHYIQESGGVSVSLTSGFLKKPPSCSRRGSYILTTKQPIGGYLLLF